MSRLAYARRLICILSKRTYFALTFSYGTRFYYSALVVFALRVITDIRSSRYVQLQYQTVD